MKRYAVFVNGKETVVKAGRAAVAVHRAMDRYIESEFRPCATISVLQLGTVAYVYTVSAEVPFDYGDNGKGYSRTTLTPRPFGTEKAAQAELQVLKAAHPDYRFFHVVRKEGN